MQRETNSLPQKRKRNKKSTSWFWLNQIFSSRGSRLWEWFRRI